MGYEDLFEKVRSDDVAEPDMSWLGATHARADGSAIEVEVGVHGGASTSSESAGSRGDAEPGALDEDEDLEDAEAERADEWDDFAAGAPEDVEPERDQDVEPVSLQKTDHQDAVQQAATRGGDGGGGEDLLPLVGFSVLGTTRESQPRVRQMPERMLSGLREILRAAAVRELGAGDRAARDFADRIGQTALVLAFVAAGLDLRVDVDATTARAVELFRSRDPQLGALIARTELLEHLMREHTATLTRTRADMKRVRTTAESVETGVSWVVADRVSNLGRDVTGVEDVNLRDPRALRMRERTREETAKQVRAERDRDGRPIR